MHNPAPVEHPVHRLIRERWSPRAFADRPVEPDTLRSLFEAARWSASSYNAQPWSFLIATREDPEAYARMLACLVSANQKWADDAPVLMISVASCNFAHNGKPNRHAFHDVGLAVAQLTLEATARGLRVHQMAGIDVEKIRRTYAIPEDHDPVAALALGYPGDPEELPDRLQERETAPRERKPLSELVFAGRWGEIAPLVETT